MSQPPYKEVNGPKPRTEGAGVSGSIDGGAGRNTLNYSAYISNVIVDLPLRFGSFEVTRPIEVT